MKRPKKYKIPKPRLTKKQYKSILKKRRKRARYIRITFKRKSGVEALDYLAKKGIKITEGSAEHYELEKAGYL